MRILGLIRVLGIGLMGLACGPAMANGPRVVVSIKPIHALVAGVMAGVGTPDLLVDGAVSEHEYALRPSQANVLSKADVIFWVGPQLESFLIRPLAALAPLAVQIALSKSPDVQLLPVRDADLLHTPPGAKNAPLYDMHIWLDPGNAGALVREISAQLQARDPANAAIYSRNALALEVRLNTSTQRISERLSALAVAPYIVFHDAYQYFEARFGLKPVAFVSIDHSRPPGAGRIRALRKQISESNVICVFAEPQFEPGLVETLVEGTAARAAVLDPLGAGLPEGVEMYFTLLDQLVQALENCSQPP